MALGEQRFQKVNEMNGLGVVLPGSPLSDTSPPLSQGRGRVVPRPLDLTFPGLWPASHSVACISARALPRSPQQAALPTAPRSRNAWNLVPLERPQPTAGRTPQRPLLSEEVLLRLMGDPLS